MDINLGPLLLFGMQEENPITYIISALCVELTLRPRPHLDSIPLRPLSTQPKNEEKIKYDY